MWQSVWAAMATSPEDRLELTPEVAARLDLEPAATAPVTLDRAGIQAALDRNEGNVSATWQELGLKNRDALRRLMRKHGMLGRASNVIPIAPPLCATKSDIDYAVGQLDKVLTDLPAEL